MLRKLFIVAALDAVLPAPTTALARGGRGWGYGPYFDVRVCR